MDAGGNTPLFWVRFPLRGVRLATLYRSMSLIFLATPFRWRPLSFQKDFHSKEKDSARVDVAGEPKPIATACSHPHNVQCRCFVTSNTILPILRLFRHSFRHQILNVIMCSLQVFADFLSCVVNFWPGDDFLGDSSAKTSIFPYNFLERQSCRDPYLSIRISRRAYLGLT